MELLIFWKTPLTITADDKTKVYLQANPDLTIKCSGFVLGQDLSVLEELPVVTTTAGTNSDAGNYDLNVSGAAGTNYSFVYIKGILTINKADQVITMGQIPAGLRMTQQYQLNATASSGLPVTFDVSDPNIGSINGDILTCKGEGSPFHQR